MLFTIIAKQFENCPTPDGNQHEQHIRSKQPYQAELTTARTRTVREIPQTTATLKVNNKDLCFANN